MFFWQLQGKKLQAGRVLFDGFLQKMSSARCSFSISPERQRTCILSYAAWKLPPSIEMLESYFRMKDIVIWARSEHFYFVETS